MKLQVQNLFFSYNENPILEDISFEAESGEIICLLGSNGAGKTTLLRCLNNIHKPKSGKIKVDSKDISKLTNRELANIFSYVPQSSSTAFPMTVIDTVLMGRSANIKFRISDEDKDIAFKILEDMNLSKLAFKDINQLSGGERQRVLIGKAIAQESSIILLDEPTSNLDMKNQLDSLRTIEELVKEKNLLAIVSIHDLNLAAMYGDKCLMIKDRKVFDFGRISKIINEENIREVYEIDAVIKEIQEYNRVILKKK